MMEGSRYHPNIFKKIWIHQFFLANVLTIKDRIMHRGAEDRQATRKIQLLHVYECSEHGGHCERNRDFGGRTFQLAMLSCSR